MMTRKSLLAFVLVLFTAFAITACGNKMDDYLNSLDSIVTKIEKIAEKSQLSQADFEEFDKLKKEAEELNTTFAGQLTGSDASAEQVTRAQDLIKRLIAAGFKIEMKRVQ